MDWATAAIEPTLDEMFAEPIVQMIMQRDGTRPNEVRQKLDEAATSKQANKRRFY